MCQSGLAGSGGMLNAVYVEESASNTQLTVIVVVTQNKLKISEWQFGSMGPRQKLTSQVDFSTSIP